MHQLLPWIFYLASMRLGNQLAASGAFTLNRQREAERKEKGNNFWFNPKSTIQMPLLPPRTRRTFFPPPSPSYKYGRSYQYVYTHRSSAHIGKTVSRYSSNTLVAQQKEIELCMNNAPAGRRSVGRLVVFLIWCHVISFILSLLRPSESYAGTAARRRPDGFDGQPRSHRQLGRGATNDRQTDGTQ